MKTIKRQIAILSLGMLISFSCSAATGNLVARVTRTLVTGNNLWGGCMAHLSKPISEAAPGCPGNWVTFSCTGAFAPKDRAFYMLDQAQLALALNKLVLVSVNDGQKHEGHCFAFRIDVIK